MSPHIRLWCLTSKSTPSCDEHSQSNTAAGAAASQAADWPMWICLVMTEGRREQPAWIAAFFFSWNWSIIDRFFTALICIYLWAEQWTALRGRSRAQSGCRRCQQMVAVLLQCCWKICLESGVAACIQYIFENCSPNCFKLNVKEIKALICKQSRSYSRDPH